MKQPYTQLQNGNNIEASYDSVNSTEFRLSIKGFSWDVKPYDAGMALALSQQFTIPQPAGILLAQRGVTLDTAESFLNPSLKDQLPDPSHLLDMDKAVLRLVSAIEKGERVTIFGDYDVDGATSTSLLIRFLTAAGLKQADFYIPDRHIEGYGPNPEAFDTIKSRGSSLVITVDCGTVAYEALDHAAAIGLDVVVMDHHIGGDSQPKAVAVVNPNRLDETSPHRGLAAVGVCFLLAVAVNRTLRDGGWYRKQKIREPNLLSLLDVVALGTICDVMPLTGLNRALVTQGLKVMAQRGNLGLRVLSDVSGLDSSPTAYHSGFVIGPRINAGGRIGKSDLGSRLLITGNEDEAITIAKELSKLNDERKALESIVLDEAITLAEAQGDDVSVIVVAKKGWHAGVIGIIASRLKDRLRKPCAVIALEDGIGKASARSVSGADIGAAITAARMEGLLLAGGGHAMAGGFTVEEEKIDELKAFLCNHMQDDAQAAYNDRKWLFDGVLPLSAVTVDLAQSLELLAPFGTGNPEPRFIIRDVQVQHVKVLKDQHIMCQLADASAFGGKARVKAMAFRAVGTELEAVLMDSSRPILHVAGKLSLNHWMGNAKAELIIDDVVVG